MNGITRRIFRPDMAGRREIAPPPKPAEIANPPALVFPPDAESAGSLLKLKRLAAELAEWRRAGLPIADKATRQARANACNAPCPYYDPSGNLGLGECRAPGCGCSRAKRWLANAQCPHPLGSQWPPVSA